MNLEIVVLDGYTLNPGDLSWASLESLGELTVYDRTDADQAAARIGAAEIVYTNKTPLGRETLDRCPNVRFIGVLATGYNVVDVAAAAERGIPVCNVPTYGTTAVAQMVFALLLEICHHVGEHAQSVREGAWTACPDFCYWRHPLIELAGKTMGIVGFGRIGQATAKLALAFGMKVLFCDSNPAAALAGARRAELSELLAQSDVISLHCPLFPDTRGLICDRTIAQMKDGAILINTSRGPLVEEDDLCAALHSGKIYAAALDVVGEEPIRYDNPLLRAPRCLITPHIAWAPRESRQRLMDVAVHNLEAFLRGEIINAVNAR